MVKNYDNILIPVDGSEATERAPDKAVEIALDDNTYSDVLNVIDICQFMGETQDTSISGDTIHQMIRNSEEYLKSLKERAKEHLGFTDVSHHIRYGLPKGIIAVDFTRDRHSDLIVMGIADMSAVERILMGSVTICASQHALSSVLIIKTDIDNKKVAEPKRRLF